MVNICLRQACCKGVTEEEAARNISFFFISSHRVIWLLFGMISDKYKALHDELNFNEIKLASENFCYIHHV